MSSQQFPPGMLYDNRLDQAPRQLLTISDVERLAKAGVTIKFEDIRSQVTPDPPSQPERRTLIDAFWDRWKRARGCEDWDFNERRFNNGRALPYQIAAVIHADKVYVFVAPIGKEPFVLQDDKLLYPSDGLMASLAMYENTQP